MAIPAPACPDPWCPVGAAPYWNRRMGPGLPPAPWRDVRTTDSAPLPGSRLGTHLTECAQPERRASQHHEHDHAPLEPAAGHQAGGDRARREQAAHRAEGIADADERLVRAAGI